MQSIISAATAWLVKGLIAVVGYLTQFFGHLTGLGKRIARSPCSTRRSRTVVCAEMGKPVLQPTVHQSYR